MRGVAQAVIERLLDDETSVSSTAVAKAAGISRQAAHKWLKALVERGALKVEGKARAARYRRRGAVAVLPRPSVLEVASAGSLYRLSARLLCAEVAPGTATLDFNGVADVGEEFLEEIFCVWAPQHPEVQLEVVNFPAALAALLDRVLQHAPRRPGTQAQEPVRLSTDWAAQ